MTESEDFLEIFTKIEVNMVIIKQFYNNEGLVRPLSKYKDYSDLYVDIYRKYESELDIWHGIGANGEEEKHMMLYYKPSDLKEYIMSDIEVEVVQDKETKLYHMAYFRKNFAPSGFERRILVASTKKGCENKEEVVKLVDETRKLMAEVEDDQA